MPQNDGSDTGTKPPNGTRSATEDPLREAVDANNLTPSEQTDAAKVAAMPPEAVMQAQAARERLAQEALLADPAEIRQLFPQVLKDMGLSHNDHLDMDEIDQALNQNQLSLQDMNYLTVLKAGYKVLSKGTYVLDDPDGISDRSLAMIDKAMNRDLKEDPAYLDSVNEAWKMGAAMGAAVGVYLGRSSPTTALVGAAAGAVVGTAIMEGEARLFKGNAFETGIYDDLQKDYKTFVDNYDHQNVSASP